MQRPPLYRDTYSNVMSRVTYQIVRLDWKKHPERYVKSPSKGVFELAEWYRWETPFQFFYFNLLSLGKCILMGYTAKMWRDELETYTKDRAIHKRRFRRKQ